jgi:hypothetical protein
VFKGATNDIDWLKYDPYAGLVSGSSFKAQDSLTGQMGARIIGAPLNTRGRPSRDGGVHCQEVRPRDLLPAQGDEGARRHNLSQARPDAPVEP